MTDASGSVRFRDVGLFDGTGDAVREHVDVDVVDGRFAAIGPTGAGDPAAADAHVIEGAGRVLMPGLVDCHVHYSLDHEDPEGIPKSRDEPHVPAAVRSTGSAARALAGGVTTARSAGAHGGIDLALRDAIAAGRIAGPRMLAAGPVVTTTGGHGFQFGSAADDIPRLLTTVRQIALDGADHIKLMASEAAMLVAETAMLSTDEAGAAQYSEEEMAAVVTDARRLGRRVMAHAQGAEAAKRATRAGVASVEHAMLADEETFELMAERGTFLVPTVLVTDIYRGIDGLDDAERRRQDDLEVRHRWSLESAIRAGVRTATGTDCGVYGVPPEMLWREVQLHHEHGLSRAAALRSGTSNGAELLGLSDEIGSIEVGKRADAILLPGDPLADLGVLERPDAIMQAGRLV